MKKIADQFSVIAYLGIAALSVALGYGALSGSLLSTHPLVAALRWFGIGFLCGGLALWTAARRYQAGKEGFNPFLVVMVIVGCLLLIISLLIALNPVAFVMAPIGAAINAVALLIAFFIVLISPAFPKPIARRWPEGGEPEPSAHASHAEAHAHAEAPDDLTLIEGIGPRISAILNEAGITRYVHVAEATPEHLTQVIKAGGFRAPFSPATWPEQARLAAEADWEALAALKRQLTAGRTAHP